MTKNKHTLLITAMSLLLCAAMVVGSTYAWFTDLAASNDNIIQSGELDVELYWATDLLADRWFNTAAADNEPIFDYQLWEPGYTVVRYFDIRNAGNLAFKFNLQLQPNGEEPLSKLAEVIDVYYIEKPSSNITSRRDLVNMTPVGTLEEVINGTKTAEGSLLAGESIKVAVALKMRESAGNDYMGLTIGDSFNLVLTATQFTHENDSFGDDYDAEATLPAVEFEGDRASGTVKVENNQVSEAAKLEGDTVSADIPTGVLVEGDTLTLSVTPKDSSEANVTLGDSENVMALDVHMDGVSADNKVPMTIRLSEATLKGLNRGNLSLYHVENGATVLMEQVESVDAFNAHNQFAYDPVTGDVVLYMASFSEVALVSESTKAWKGEYDYSWYKDKSSPYTIANADQLAALGAIVGGMAKDEDGNYIVNKTEGEDNDIHYDSFSGKTVKLISDINLGDKDNANESLIFRPIGYYYTDDKNADGITDDCYSTVYSFEGTFDGAGHTVSNFYQNTWEIKGDYDGNYYSDAMGLFGYIVNGKVCNLTVSNFSSDGEFTPTGVVAAYAVNSTFENIAIVDCNPRVYNTGNGGIVGIGGNSDDPDDYKLTFTNITIDNTNKITALWGSWDVACGGLVGMFRGDGHVHMTNCHVAAQIDVYNDVCGNYQYYWYRYSGMMVGTNKNMTTDANGYTVPETDKFHAENCTVHFGEWNDYYYCELVANSLASYTHDHQFSRLTKVKAVNGMTITPLEGDPFTVPASGRYNYVVVNGEASTENATCYHFVDGKVWNHADAGEETVDVDGDGVKETVLKEDRQHYYLPFNQLFTGYGWGVKHIPVYNGEDYAFEGITILDREVADSVEKFVANADIDLSGVTTGTSVTAGELFSAISGVNPAIRSDSVIVAVTDLTNTGITAEFDRNESNWTKGTLKFNGTNGIVKITIQDYHYCKPTSVIVTVGEFKTTDRFAIKLPNYKSYLYRVGNQNSVSLSSLFTLMAGVTTDDIGNVNVTVTNLAEETLEVYTAGSGEWDSGTIKFADDFTGPVLVTISDDNYSTPVELYLEVVNATNVTTYSDLKNKNSVLLNDITMSSGGSYYLSNATLYGNGFTFDVSNGAYSGKGQISSNYLVSLTNANLDNVKIVGAVYTSYGATASSEYNRPVVLSIGNNTITNCYISNCAAPVRVRDGNLEVVNSTLKGGNFANLDIRGGHVVLDNVVTINQVNSNDTAADGTIVVGLGVVVYYEKVLNTTTIEIKNGISQFNHLSKTQANNYIKDSTAKNLVNQMFSSTYSAVQYSDGNDTWVNTGILSMTDAVGDDNVSDVDGYVDATPTMSSTTGYLHTSKPDADSINETAPEYTTSGQGPIAPSYTFDYTTKNYMEKTDGSNDYCYQQEGTVYLSMDAGDIFNWDTSILTATKNGQTLGYTVSMNGTDYTGKSIAFNTAGNYEVVYTYTDNSNYQLDDAGNITTYSKTYTKTVHLSVAVMEAAAKNAEFTMGSSNVATEKITVDNVTYISAAGVPDDNTNWASMTISGKTIYYPIVAAKLTATKGSASYAYFPVFENVVTIKDYKDNGTSDEYDQYDQSTTRLPSTLKAVKGVYKDASEVSTWSTLTNSNLTQNGPTKIFKWASSSDAPSEPEEYNGVLCFKSPKMSADRNIYITLVQYSYTDSTNTTYYYYVGYTIDAFDYQQICVTPDTLVTLADGTQKRIDQVTYADELLVWNFYTGEYDVAPVSLLVNHGEDSYEIIELTFDDGTTLEIVGCHGVFDADLNEFVDIDASNVESLVGHSFLKQNADGFETAKLMSYNVKEEVNGSFTLLTAEHHNAILNGMLTISPSMLAENLYEAFTVGEGMRYDEDLMLADIEKYGLYTYEEFADYLSYDQFVAWNIANMKVVVGKGYTTYEDIVTMLIEVALPNV